MSSKPFIRLVHAGGISGGQTWSTGLSLWTDSVASPTELAAFCASVSPLFASFWASAGGPSQYNPSECTVKSLHAYSYDAGATKATAEGSVIMSLTGTGVRSLPYQCAVVHSLRTGYGGRAGRGRCYFPIGISAALTTGQLDSSFTATLATQFAGYLTALNALVIPATNNGVSVVSLLRATEPIKVAAVEVDSVVDTQRRRRDKIGATSTGYHLV